MLNSDFRELCGVDLPFKNRQRYMHGFDLANPVMAEGFEDYLEPVIALCKTANATIGKAWMTVDEKIVSAGNSQRRPGPHVDGQYLTHSKRWGHGGGGGGWNHSCNGVPLARMPIIVAASVEGCRAWRGQFDAQPDSGGDLSHIADQLGEGTVVPANIGYLLSPDCIHESMVFEQDVQRTFLRIALPVDYEF